MSTLKQLSPENIRTYKGHENLTDEQAEQLHEQLTQLAAILIRVYPIQTVQQEIKQRDKNEHSSK